MKTFNIDFSGYCEIEAEDRERAETIFWSYIIQHRLPLHTVCSIDNPEEKIGK